jgi:hypothetical protein
MNFVTPLPSLYVAYHFLMLCLIACCQELELTVSFIRNQNGAVTNDFNC